VGGGPLSRDADDTVRVLTGKLSKTG
jgi:hypothetical protein